MHAKSFFVSSALLVSCLIVSAFALPVEFSSPKAVALRADCPESESKETLAVEVGKAYAYLNGDLVQAGTVETVPSECGAMIFTPLPDPVVSPENFRAAFLLEADLATLWRLQNVESKQHVQKLAEMFLSRLRERLKSALKSDVFRTRYEPRLWEIVNESYARTMEDEQIREDLKMATEGQSTAKGSRVEGRKIDVLRSFRNRPAFRGFAELAVDPSLQLSVARLFQNALHGFRRNFVADLSDAVVDIDSRQPLVSKLEDLPLYLRRSSLLSGTLADCRKQLRFFGLHVANQQIDRTRLVTVFFCDLFDRKLVHDERF